MLTAILLAKGPSITGGRLRQAIERRGGHEEGGEDDREQTPVEDHGRRIAADGAGSQGHKEYHTPHWYLQPIIDRIQVTL